jgi:hypothetical protein
VIAILLAALLAAPTSGAAPRPTLALSRDLTPAELAERVDAYLNTIDVPIEPDEWRALGPAAAARLEQLARSPDALPTRRAKAVWGLVFISGSSASGVLAELAARDGEELPVRLAAVRGLGAALPAGQLQARLGPVLERAADPRVRATAAAVLVERTAGGACALVRGRAAVEEGAARSLFAPATEACGH